MNQAAGRRSLLRRRQEHEHGKVTFVELFFDLVFVFAITQLSHSLLKDLTLLGAVHTGLLFLAVWWVWIYTSWVTNWLDPERTPVRLLLLVLMLAGLILSTSLPEAFAEKGLAFAGAYVFMQVGRSLFMAAAVRRHSAGNFRNFQRITAWLILSALFWIAGAFTEAEVRLALWAAALAIEYVSPSLGFWTPGLGRSTTADWDVEGGHMAERCGLFVIIALGESILVTGATFAELEPGLSTIAAFVTSFIGSVAMWWIYFDIGAERGSHTIARSDDPGRLARIAYTYIHLLIVAGIIVGAVADELVLAHPDGHPEAGTAAALLGGPALYLIGNTLFKWTTAGRLPLSHLAGLVLLAGLVPGTVVLSPLLLGVAVMLILVLVAVWERLSLRRGREAGLSSAEIG
ncbi:low temperature requirement protein LtrA [Inquilinus ginsengisoli]|uniref:Low temperature requirement protein LtrA n=1 Tax=Inquilinus ginsengisoli TaxID=363840 RepID=A0ABU1JLK7_9PROT|nr:low temperature requirement protein A [Inquilinus ginsengisoli]MDR6289507.1 low temperature requirement protein LtrA [Inquilinus ginsengisoli]